MHKAAENPDLEVRKDILDRAKTIILGKIKPCFND